MPAGRRENTKNPGMAETDKKNQDGAFFKNLRPGGVYKKKLAAFQTDQQLMPPRRCRSLAPMGGGVRHKKINGGRQSNGRLAPRLVVCVVHFIWNKRRWFAVPCHVTPHAEPGRWL